jgi:hypothetical protein
MEGPLDRIIYDFQQAALQDVLGLCNKDSSGQGILEYLQSLQTLQKSIGTLRFSMSLRTSVTGPLDRYPIDSYADFVLFAIFVCYVARLGIGRCLFQTSRGNLGLGPDQMQPDDVVVVIFGADVPFVLRPHEKGYKLIGEAYVHGIMDGELMTAQLTEEVFKLY